MRFPAVLSARIRGFRVVNILGFGVVIAVAVGGYTLKTIASAQDAQVQHLDDQIASENRRIRMLRLEIARLGAAPRVEALSRQYLNLAPIDPRRDIAAEALPAIVRQPAISTPAIPTPAIPTPGIPATAILATGVRR